MNLFEFDRSDKILLVGEGNFSFSCCLLKLLRKEGDTSQFSNFYSTCFQTVLSPVALTNVNFLKTQGAEVLLGVDATKLEAFESLNFFKFNKIIFNFPHVGGKMKIHLNRALLCNFFVSCSNMLTEDGKVFVTLCSGQGGTEFEGCIRRWDDTWQIVEQAAHGSFILSHIEYFPLELFHDYEPVGYRGREQKFSVKSSVVHVFSKVAPPLKNINPIIMENVSNLHIVDGVTNLSVSYAHKLAIIKNPFKNEKSVQNFLFKKLFNCMKDYVKEPQIYLNLPYHTTFDPNKASCLYKGSWQSLRSSLSEVVPCGLANFITNGLVFQKFGSDFNCLGSHCQVVFGGKFRFKVLDIFFEFIKNTFGFNIDISVVQEGCDWFMKVSSCAFIKKVAFDNSYLGSITIEIDSICLLLFNVSIKELWAERSEFDSISHRLILPSFYPPEFHFDISFASKKEFDEDKFFNLLHQTPDNLINSIKLLSVYQHPNSDEISYCYRLSYKSYEKALHRKLVIDIHHNVIRKLVENILHVTVH